MAKIVYMSGRLVKFYKLTFGIELNPNPKSNMVLELMLVLLLSLSSYSLSDHSHMSNPANLTFKMFSLWHEEGVPEIL